MSPRTRRRSEILEGGYLRVVHVFIKALRTLIERKDDTPVWAVRDYNPRTKKFDLMTVYDRLEILGHSWSNVQMENPLPGTEGRGVAPLYTKAPIKVYWYGEKPEAAWTYD